MAHIQRRERGGTTRWVARYRAEDGTERSKTFDRKVDAETWLSTQKADQARGEWVDPQLGRISFREFARRWEDNLHGLRPNTVALNTGILHNHLLPRFADRQLSTLTPTDVKAMVGEAMAEGYAPSTVRRMVFVLSLILDEAILEGRLARNVTAGVKLPADTSTPMRFLEPDEVAHLAETFRPHYRPLMYTAAYVGLRWGELAGLKPERVDLLRRTIVITEQLVEVGGHLPFGPPKTSASKRTVSVPAGLVELLTEHLGRRPVRTSGLVFPTASGTPMRRSNFRKVWKRAVERAGWGEEHRLEGLTFHELRHTAAALAIAQGAHPLTIKERLGHSSIRTTMDTYGHLFPAQDEALAEALDGLFRGSDAGRMRDGDGTVKRFPRSEAG